MRNEKLIKQAMRMAAREGFDPRNSYVKQAKVVERMCHWRETKKQREWNKIVGFMGV